VISERGKHLRSAVVETNDRALVELIESCADLEQMSD